MIPSLHLSREGDCWYATGVLPDGAHYAAVGSSRVELEQRVRESAEAEGWHGWALCSTGATVQFPAAVSSPPAHTGKPTTDTERR